jgi:c(7)-type cytochrome triheme protein
MLWETMYRQKKLTWEGQNMRLLAILTLAALTGGSSGAFALELKDITFNTEGGGKVVFSHKLHLQKKAAKTANTSCKTCHPSTNDRKQHFTMADMEKGKSCGQCHTGQKAFSISKCTGCHKVKEITFQVKETGPVHFSHNQHLKSMQCNACHNRLYATGPNKSVSMAEMEKGKSCGACHNGGKAFSIAKCDACHPAPKQVVFKVKETGPTVFSHSRHLKQYSCSACHTRLFALGSNKRASMAAMEKGRSCGACHNDRDAFSVAQCQKCHPTREITFKLAGVSNAKFSHTAHTSMYKCDSCHTGTFPLKSSSKPVTMKEMYQAKSCGSCHDGKSAFTVHGNCDTCHIKG